jgi:hypothetical protein
MSKLSLSSLVLTMMQSTGLQEPEPTAPVTPQSYTGINQVVDEANCDYGAKWRGEKWDQLDLLERGLSAMFNPDLFK